MTRHTDFPEGDYMFEGVDISPDGVISRKGIPAYLNEEYVIKTKHFPEAKPEEA